jgi:5-methylcytosine-specific restriction protein A
MRRLCACGNLVPKGERCPCQVDRKAEQQRAADAKRPSAHARGYDREWQRESKRFLGLPGNDLCACGSPATLVDHRKAHKGDQRLFWDPANWQPMCRPCNSRKNVRQEGGFGR